MEYKGYRIKMTEAHQFGDDKTEYIVRTKTLNKLVYEATCAFGSSFALNPNDALNGAKLLIDKHTS